MDARAELPAKIIVGRAESVLRRRPRPTVEIKVAHYLVSPSRPRSMPATISRMSQVIFLAVAFAALCVWLAVRIVNRRERWAKQAAIIMALMLVQYPLSIGPAHCLAWGLHSESFSRTADVVYGPVVGACKKSDTAMQVLFWYTTHWELLAVHQGVRSPPGFEQPSFAPIW